MLYRYLFLLCILMFGRMSCAFAQQFNLGAHINPTISNAVVSKDSKYDDAIKISRIKPGFNAGLDLNYTSGMLNIHSGINLVQKAVGFYTKYDRPDRGYNSFKVTYFSHSLELPLILSYNIHRHDYNDIVYDLYLSAGWSYENYNYSGVSWTFSSVNASANILAEPVDNFARKNDQWVNFILGFKINTIIRNVGLIDYGLDWHIPMAESDIYHVRSYVRDLDLNKDYLIEGSFKLRQSYFDIKLCYYFLNYDRQGHRIPYKRESYFQF